MFITENYLVTDYRFKRKTKNKVKFFVNSEFGITLTKDATGGFYNDETKETYYENGDIIKIIRIKSIEQKSKKFRAGLPQINLDQGDFDKVYRKLPPLEIKELS